MTKLCKKKKKHLKTPRFLAHSLGFFIGMSIGFLISPIKQGMGNHSGNNTTTNHYYGKDALKEQKKDA